MPSRSRWRSSASPRPPQRQPVGSTLHRLANAARSTHPLDVDVADVAHGDQLGATLGRWFGLSKAQLLQIVPNLTNFNASRRNLGFML